MTKRNDKQLTGDVDERTNNSVIFDFISFFVRGSNRKMEIGAVVLSKQYHNVSTTTIKLLTPYYRSLAAVFVISFFGV